MTRRTAALMATIGLVAVGASAALLLRDGGAGAVRRRWETKVAELRATGEPLDASDFRLDPVREEDNAETVLREVHDAYCTLWPGDDLGPTDYPQDYETQEFSEEEREHLEAWWPDLEPLYERLEAAARSPVLVGTSHDPLDASLIPWVQDAGRLWSIRSLLRPSDGEAMAVQNLRLVLTWQPRNQFDVLVRWSHAWHAVRLLHWAVDAGHVDVVKSGPAIREMLRRAEEGWLDHFQLALRAGTAAAVRHVAWSTGSETAPEDVCLIHLPELDADPEQFYTHVLSVLDANTSLLRAVQTEDDLRSAANQGAQGELGVPMHLCVSALAMLAHVRLARWALFLHEERAAGRAPSDDLAAYADRFPDGPPLDPSTGRRFRWVEREGGRLISVDVERVRTLDLFMGFLHTAPEPVQDEELTASELAWFLPD